MPSVLIVDDVPESVRLLDLVLRGEGYEVIAVSAPHLVFEHFKRRHIDVIIADQNMPGMSGEQLLERIGALWPQTRRLMLTADPRIKPDPDRPYNVIYKPFRVSQVRDEIRRLVAAES